MNTPQLKSCFHFKRPFFQRLFLVIVFLVSGQQALASEHKAREAQDQRFGVVTKIQGDVIASELSKSSVRNLYVGSPVFVGERIRATSLAEAVIETEDGGAIAVRPGAEFVAIKFAAEGKQSDNLTINLVTGSLRVITGWIGKLNRSEHRISTPFSWIGIRGTDHEPYVLPEALANAPQYAEGTYDKVNRGATTLGEAGHLLEIEAGQVGFMRKVLPKKNTRGLMTLLMPVLLDKVPEFYVPGQFDAELDQFSKTSDAYLSQKLEQRIHGENNASCIPADIAKDWLTQFDNHVKHQDARAVLDLFSTDVTLQATVLNNHGKATTIEFDRQGFAESTVAATKGLKNYSQRRLTIEAENIEPELSNACKKVSVSSVVIEQGQQSGKPYRLESKEKYTLELRDGKWIAVKAQTIQQ
ncbi:MAG: hypothetical protein PHY62_11620 [Gallionella sp.]|nr:hypothetical protein [Gallionella sp.]